MLIYSVHLIKSP